MNWRSGSAHHKLPRRARLHGWRQVLTSAMTLVVAVLALLLVIANLTTAGSGDQKADAAATERVRAERQTVLASTPTLQPPGIVFVDGTAMDDLGVFLAVAGRTAGAPVGDIVNRAALIGVRVNGEAYLLDSPATDWTLTGASEFRLGLRGRAEERSLRLDVSLEFSPRGYPGSVRVVGPATGALAALSPATGASSFSLLIEVEDEAGRPLRSMLTRDGRLLVAREPLPASSVVDHFTGALLDVSHATEFGYLPRAVGGWAFTICDESGAPGESCIVSWRKSGRGYIAPVPGVLTCPGGRTLRFSTEQVVLTFRLAASVQGTVDFECEPEELDAGRALLPDGDWLISAESPGGEPLSITVADDGTLRVGPVAGVTGCPCRQGS